MIDLLYKKRMQSILTNSIHLQEGTLHSIIRKNAETTFGKEHSFSAIKDYRDFASKIEPRGYEAVFQYLQRADGASPSLTSNRIDWYAITSGTTARQKLIPVSSDFLKRNHYSVGRLSLFHLRRQFHYPWFSHGQTLSLAGYSYPFKTFGKPSIDISALISQQVPLFFKLFNFPNRSFESWKEKIDFLKRHKSSTCRASIIAGIPTWTLALLDEFRKEFGEDPQMLFPNLRLLVHGGLDFGVYRETFKEIFNDRRLEFFEIYNMTEGFVGFQFEREKPGLLLVTDASIFFEFKVREGNRILPLWEIEVGEEYELLLTTSDGLYRYLTGDVICFSSKNPFLFTIVGRTTESMNSFGEHLSVSQINSALAQLRHQINFAIRDYFLVPHFATLHGKGFHEWYIEFDHEPPNKLDFEQKLDRLLQEASTSYAQKREGDIGILPPQVVTLARGTIARMLEMRGHLGGQIKQKKLYQDRLILEVLGRVQQESQS